MDTRSEPITASRGRRPNGATAARRSGAASGPKARPSPTRTRETAMMENEPTMAGRDLARDIDQTVERMEQLYRVVTGRDAPVADADYAPIPAEKDPAEYVERRLNQLLELLGAVPEAARNATAWISPMSGWEGGKEILIRLGLPGGSRGQGQGPFAENRRE